MRNMYPGKCLVCGNPVVAGAGYFQSKGSLPKEERAKIYGKWLLRCKRCVGSGNTGVLLKSLRK